MICTTVYSNIASALANFSDEIEKEEVVAFKAYLRQAIAKFAAVDNSPNPQKIPSHSRPTKDNSSGSGKGKNIELNIAVAIPQIPGPSQTQNTWVTVARNSQKEARVTPSTSTRITPMSKIRPQKLNMEKSSAAPTEKRLFLRLPQEHEWRKLSPAGICKVIFKKLLISPTLIGKIKPVHSGFALSPCSTEARGKILNAGNGLFLTGAKLEEATIWAIALIPTVPAFIRKEHGEVEVSNSMLADQVERVYSIQPAHLKLHGGNKTEAQHRIWMAFFPKAPRGNFKLFDESGIARPFKKQQTLKFCKRCNGQHSIKNCFRSPSCGNCGSTNPTEDLCMAATKRRNCGVPHRSDSRRCLPRPIRSGAPTKEQLKPYRQVGERDFQAVLQAKAAEELAASDKTNNTELTSSQASEVNNDTDNIPALSVGLPTVDAMRL
ncbi:putative eka-like protein [Erysiphe necator]|uniref:Putative eka-like protein n=1 Tax=Uncinula necator TaxID=52586 RepID=A0A0B1PG45_UNCNE|nr:putative eka-like protein [Erysiphe necator]